MFSKDELNSFNSRETPFFFYNINLLSDTLEKAKKTAEEHNFRLHYALKANSNEPILKLISRSGYGADCVSGNEITQAIKCGFSSGEIAFAGVGKTDAEIITGLENEIFSFNCESVPELEVIDQIASSMGKKANIALRINPNINAKTHEYITTGLEENKFGINTWELDGVLEKISQLPNLELKGLHFHIGSQITELSIYKGLCIRVNEIQRWFIDHKIITDHVNLGGGFGVEYEHPDSALIPDFHGYFRVFRDHLELRPAQHAHFELGRAIVAQCGSLLTRVLFIKKGVNTNFAIVDAGMTELIRPALYQAYHRIEKIGTSGDGNSEGRYDVVGPICESSDCFAKSILMPPLSRGDMLVIRTVGAYGEVMSSGYNLRSKAQSYYSVKNI